MKFRSLNHKPVGAHLMEVIIATSLFFLVSIFLLTLLPSAQWASRKAEHLMTAEHLLHSEVERLRGEPFSNMVPGTQNLTVRSNDVSFEIEITVDDVPPADPDLVKRARVTVSWADGRVDRSIQDTVMIGKIRK